MSATIDRFIFFQLIEKALEEAGNDIGSAINRLNEFHHEGLKKSGLTAEERTNLEKGMFLEFTLSS